MRHYELVVVLSPILSQEDSSGAWERIKELINRHGCDITQEEQWGMRRLAYPIRRAGQTFLEGNYLLTRFSTDTSVPRELEAHLGLSEDVLRSLIVKSAPPKPAPPVLDQAVAVVAEEPPAEAETETIVADEPAVEEGGCRDRDHSSG